jgi:hypothetical protein
MLDYGLLNCYKKGNNIIFGDVLMLEVLITSALRREVLAYLLNNPDQDLHLREFSRRIKKPAPVVKKELDKLDQIGFILTWTSKNQRRFKLNKTFLFLPELTAIFDKEAELSVRFKVAKTVTLEKGLNKRKSWQKRAAEIAQGYGEDVKRRRPRHPAETRMLKKIS